DSFAVPQVAGVRSTNTLNRQLLYKAGDFSIDLQVAPAGQSQAEITGQILRQGETAFESVTHLHIRFLGEKQNVSVTTNAMGEFSLHDIPQGFYDARIETGEGNVEIFGIPIESAKC